MGAGPIGLLSALEARAAGMETIVVEKRHNYTRDIWCADTTAHHIYAVEDAYQHTPAPVCGV